MGQCVTRSGTWKSHIRPPAFRRGFEDAWNGLPPQFDIDPPPGKESLANLQWAYERGRAFAIWCKAQGTDPRPLKEGNRIPWRVITDLQEAVRARAVI